MNRRSVTAVVLVVASFLLVACGEGSDRQIASNSKADQQTPAAPTAPPRPAVAKASATTTTVAADVGATVAVKDDLFEPAEVQVTTGQAVEWRWQGKNPHNVAGSGYKSKIQSSGAFTRTFGKAGSFEYRCEVHPSMTGTVVVAG